MEIIDKLTEAKLYIVCGAIELIQHNYDTFIYKNSCMNSSQTRNKWLREVLNGNDDRCFRMLMMKKFVFINCAMTCKPTIGYNDQEEQM